MREKGGGEPSNRLEIGGKRKRVLGSRNFEGKKKEEYPGTIVPRKEKERKSRGLLYSLTRGEPHRPVERKMEEIKGRKHRERKGGGTVRAYTYPSRIRTGALTFFPRRGKKKGGGSSASRVEGGRR